MTRRRIVLSRLARRLLGDRIGGAAIEFALLAPVFIALMMGVVEVGIYMQNYNAVRSLASDASRFAAVEYQKSNKLDATALKSNIEALGQGSPYNLMSENLTVTVTEVSSRVGGAKEFRLDIAYDLPNFINGTSIDDITLNYTRPLFVIDS